METSIGRVIAERYRLDRSIGSGGMGNVFAGFDLRLERPVAVKMIRSIGSGDAQLRFEREARVAAQVRSPYVVAVYDVGTTADGEGYLVQELLTGEDLANILARGRLPDPCRAVRLAVQICKALSAIHSAGFVHRDIKPSNLFLERSDSGAERIVLLDFGIAKDDETAMNITGVGILGTPAYMSPEQIFASSKVDARTDLYSLGATLFELLTDRAPFWRENAMATLANIISPDRSALTFPEGCGSPELQAIILRCLSVDPEARYPSASELMQALLSTPEGREAPDGRELPEPPPAARSAPEESEFTSSALTTTANLSEVPPPAPPPPKAPRRGPQKSPRAPPQDLARYLEQAGLLLEDEAGPLLSIERQPDCRLPPFRLSAILLEPEDQPLSMQTMGTVFFKQRASPLYALEGTLEEPHHVLALFRSPPGAGVYREWHELATRRHIHVTPVAPSALRAAVESKRAAAHLLDLLRRARRDPFDLEGRVAAEIDFFGSREELRAFLHQLDGAGAGLGLFGLEKWGTTSLLIRFRAEIADRITAFIDLAALPSLSLTQVFSALHEDLSRALGDTTQPALQPHGDAESALRQLLEIGHTKSGARPVLFLDRVDELSRRERCPPEGVIAIARALYRLAFPRSGRAGAVLVFGGREDHLLVARSFGDHPNPLCGAVSVRYAPFFSREELGDFLERLGALCGLTFSPAALSRAFALTGGHKYLSRRLGSLIHQRQSSGAAGSVEVTPELVLSCASALVTRHHHYFDAVVERAPPALREVLARLVAGPASALELRKEVTANDPRDCLSALKFADDYHLVREEHGRYRLTVGIFEEWLRWTHDSRPKPAADRFTPPPPPPPANPSNEEIQWLQDRIREGFSSPHDLEILARTMGIAPAEAIRTNTVLPVQISDLVDWAVRNRRFSDLIEAVRRERPTFFQGGVGHTIVLPTGIAGLGRRSGEGGAGAA